MFLDQQRLKELFSSVPMIRPQTEGAASFLATDAAGALSNQCNGQLKKVRSISDVWADESFIPGLSGGHRDTFIKRLGTSRPTANMVIHRAEGATTATCASPTPANLLNVCFKKLHLSPLTKLFIATLYWTFSLGSPERAKVQGDAERLIAFEEATDAAIGGAEPAADADADGLIKRAVNLPDGPRNLVMSFIGTRYPTREQVVVATEPTHSDGAGAPVSGSGSGSGGAGTD